MLLLVGVAKVNQQRPEGRRSEKKKKCQSELLKPWA